MRELKIRELEMLQLLNKYREHVKVTAGIKDSNKVLIEELENEYVRPSF